MGLASNPHKSEHDGAIDHTSPGMKDLVCPIKHIWDSAQVKNESDPAMQLTYMCNIARGKLYVDNSLAR